MDLMVSILLGFISTVRSEVLSDQVMVVQAFTFQHGLTAFVAGGQISGKKSPSNGTHFLWDT